MNVGLIIDDIAGATGNGPIIISEINHGRTYMWSDIDVARRRIRLIQDVGDIALHVKSGHRGPIYRFTHDMLGDDAGLLLAQNYSIWEDSPLTVNCGANEIVAGH